MAIYDRGDRARIGNHSASLAAAFKDPSNTDADPNVSITLMLKDPAGTTVTYTYAGSPALLKETTGRYYIDYDITDNALIGTYYYRLAGTGTNVRAAEEGSFSVKASLVLA